MTTLATFPQIKPLSSKPSPGELVEFSRAVRAALQGLQAVPQQVAALKQAVGVVAGAVDGELVAAPTVPLEFTVTPLFAKIMLQWAPAGYAGHAYTEIWRAQVDDLGQAVLQDRETFVLWVDEALPSNALGSRYFYWIRHVNANGVAGAFNAVAGTAASTADDPEYLLQIATEKWKPNFNYAVSSLSIPTVPNGYSYEVTFDGGASGAVEPVWPTVIDQTVIDGGLTWRCKAPFSFETFFKVALVNGVPRLTLSELFLADLVVKRGMIGNLAVDDAKINNLSVAKLLAGVISASNIFLGAESRVHLDGQNNRIVVTDAGGVTRVVLGKLAVGYGIEIYDAGGQMILGSGGVSLSKVSGAGSLAGQNSVNWATQVSDKSGLAALTQITNANRNTALALKVIGGAFIDDAAVNTLQIAGNAVTVPESAHTADVVVAGTSDTTVQSLYIDSQGQPVLILASFTHLEGGASGTMGTFVSIYRSSTLVYSAWFVGGFSGTGFYQTLQSFSVKDTPPGPVTYYLKIRGSARPQNISNRTLLLLGVKR